MNQVEGARARSLLTLVRGLLRGTPARGDEAAVRRDTGLAVGASVPLAGQHTASDRSPKGGISYEKKQCRSFRI
jgi:hypothetical protein